MITGPKEHRDNHHCRTDEKKKAKRIMDKTQHPDAHANNLMDLEIPMYNDHPLGTSTWMEIEGKQPRTVGQSKPPMLRAISWNIRSINKTSKIQKILSLDADISFVQEIWLPEEEFSNSLFSEIDQVTVRREQRGGGTWIKTREEYLYPANEPNNLNKDSTIRKYIVASNKMIWLASLYMNKSTKNTIQELMGKIQSIVPEYEWPNIIISRDWNIDISCQNQNDKANLKKVETLQILTRSMGLKIQHSGATRQGAILDFIVSGEAIKITDLHTLDCENLSDHKILCFNIVIEPSNHGLKKMKVPNKKMAESFTRNSLLNCNNSNQFLKEMKRRLKTKNMETLIEIKKKPFKRELLQRLMSSVNEDDDFRRITNVYWREKAEENELYIHSGKMKEAFDFIKRVFKYNELSKRDGAIINKVLDSNGKIVTKPEIVDRLVIDNLKRIQTSDKEPMYTVPTPFPKLQPLTEKEMEIILASLSTHKALAFDALSDNLFGRELQHHVKTKLGDLWTTLAHHQTILQLHFDARLIPLNKVYPNVAKPNECRPIVISSPLVKLLEARIKPKLDEYMTRKLHVSQVGFVTNTGITMNHQRLIERIQLRIGRGQHTYGLFVDFSNAFNTILHSKLFQKLEKVLDKEEVELIQAIYSCTKIRLGSESFTPNVGVAQGSILSPALFNLYCEELYELLENELGINVEDICGYADDLLVICTSLEQLRRTITLLRTWSSTNNLLLNVKKSGIIEFLPRLGRQCHYLLSNTNTFEGIPIVNKYKYLGLWVNNKLTINDHLANIKEKSDYQSLKLWPLLKNTSLDFRINLWTILIRPMFEMVTCIHRNEKAQSNKKAIERMLTRTFKKFTLLKKNTNNKTIKSLMNFDLEERIEEVIRLNRIKWNARKLHETPKYPMSIKKHAPKIFYPKELQEILNLKTALCPKCGVPCSSKHLLSIHQIYIPGDEGLLRLLSDTSSRNKGRKRNDILEAAGRTIKPFLEALKDHLGRHNLY